MRYHVLSCQLILDKENFCEISNCFVRTECSFMDSYTTEINILERFVVEMKKEKKTSKCKCFFFFNSLANTNLARVFTSVCIQLLNIIADTKMMKIKYPVCFLLKIKQWWEIAQSHWNIYGHCGISLRLATNQRGPYGTCVNWNSLFGLFSWQEIKSMIWVQILEKAVGFWFGFILWHINQCMLFNDNFFSYIYIKYMISKHIL